MPRKKLSNYIGSEPRARCLSEQEVKIIVEKTVAQFLSGIIDKINELSREIDSLRRELQELRRECARPASKAGRALAGKERKKGNLYDKIRIILSENGYVFAGQLARELRLPPARILDIARDLGYTLIDLGGDYVIIDPYSLEEFSQILSSISSPDPLEASRQLGKYATLFEKLRSESLVFYDGRTKKWRIIR